MTILSYKYTFWGQSSLKHTQMVVWVKECHHCFLYLVHIFDWNDSKGRNIPRIVQPHKTSAIGKVMTEQLFEPDR